MSQSRDYTIPETSPNLYFPKLSEYYLATKLIVCKNETPVLGNTIPGSCHKHQKPQAPIRNRQTRKVANAKGLNRNTNLT